MELLHRSIVRALDILIKLLEELFALVLFLLNGSISQPDDHFRVLVVLLGLRDSPTSLPRRHGVVAELAALTSGARAARDAASHHGLPAQAEDLHDLVVDFLDLRGLVLSCLLHGDAVLVHDRLREEIHRERDADDQ
mmetsp:Transcript_47936/g.63446  ORF Transcript_47936/g.63446 Transcript_47936/m.63446 type:complete len:137 (-) Transcript_47936:1867-2277(-)